MDYMTLVQRARNSGLLDRVAQNTLAQFGTPDAPLLGAQLLPELPRPNEFTEDMIVYRSPIANHGSRYSAAQYKDSALVGSFRATLSHSDIGSDITAKALDAINAILNRNADLQAAAVLTNFLDSAINVPLVHRNEADRWQAIVNAMVPLRGDNGYTENVTYPNPTGNRVTLADAWSNDANDPYVPILAIKRAAAAKGLKIARIISTTTDLSILSQNANVQRRVGRPVMSLDGASVTLARGSATLDQLAQSNQMDGLPAFEIYDEIYQTQQGTAPFLPVGNMVFICNTRRDPGRDIETLGALPPEVLARVNGFVGYTGIGIPAGATTNGRRIWSEGFDNKPPRIEAEGWQTSLPIITDPDSIFVLKGIA